MAGLNVINIPSPVRDGRNLIQHLGLVIISMLLQKNFQLLLETFLPMMFFLRLDVMNRIIHARYANAKCAKTFLPCKTLWAEFGNVSRNHFDELPFNNCIALETESVAGKLKSKCTWSATPPMASVFMSFSRAMPPRYGQRSSRMVGVSHGRRSEVENTQCIRQELKECMLVSR